MTSRNSSSHRSKSLNSSLPSTVVQGSHASVAASSVTCSVMSEDPIPDTVRKIAQQQQELKYFRSLKSNNNQRLVGTREGVILEDDEDDDDDDDDDSTKGVCSVNEYDSDDEEINALTQLFAQYDSLLDDLTTINLRLRATEQDGNDENYNDAIPDMDLSRDEVLETLDELRSLSQSVKSNGSLCKSVKSTSSRASRARSYKSRRSSKGQRGGRSVRSNNSLRNEEALEELSVVSKSIASMASSLDSNSLIDKSNRFSSEEEWKKSRKEAQDKLKANSWIIRWIYEMQGGTTARNNNKNDDRPSLMHIRAYKDTKKAKLGINMKVANGFLQISFIDPDGLLGDTVLRRGDFIVGLHDSRNYHDCRHWLPSQAALYMTDCIGYVTLVVRNPFGDMSLEPMEFEGEKSQRINREARLREAEQRYESFFPSFFPSLDPAPLSPTSVAYEEQRKSSPPSDLSCTSSQKHEERRRPKHIDEAYKYSQEDYDEEEQLKSELLRIKQRYKQW